jgi:hypothetical protein
MFKAQLKTAKDKPESLPVFRPAPPVQTVKEHVTKDVAFVTVPARGVLATTIDCASIILPITPPGTVGRAH